VLEPLAPDIAVLLSSLFVQHPNPHPVP